MNVIIPPKRRDKKTSFKKLVEYVSTRQEKKASDIVTPDGTAEHTHDIEYVTTPGFGQLVNYVGRKSTASVTQVHSISPEGIQRVSSGEVRCETNCWSLGSAAAEMNMTAMQNRHCKDPVYHFILSWQSDENPSDDAIFQSARYCLESLGMKDHQYVAAIHKDTDNIHCHVSANRVHPETFRAQNMWNDADTLQKCCRVLERDLGFKVDNGSWHMDEFGDLHRTPRDMPAAPRGAARREIFSDRESLHGYAVLEVRDVISKAQQDDRLDWPWLHTMLHTRGLGLREQSGGLAVYDLLQPDGVSVKASDIHPAISLPAMEAKCGEFSPAPPAFNPERPQDGITGILSHYNPQLHVRDQDLRQERREARAVAREILRARFDAYREGWEKPDLRARERFREIHSHCVAMKAHVRKTVRDPLLRKLMYRMAEFEKMKAMATLRLQLREERQVLADTGMFRPLSWKQWVEREAVNGDIAALSQMRGWAYREKRKARQSEKNSATPGAVIVCAHGDDAPIFRSSEHDTQLRRDGSVTYLRNGQPAVTDFGNRVEVYTSSDARSERFNNDLAAALTAWRSEGAQFVKGNADAVRRVLYSGSMHNLQDNDGRRFTVRDSQQQKSVSVTESFQRKQGQALGQPAVQIEQARPQNDEIIRPDGKLPRP
ncbi:TraI/MobA(P) family conjugative relaxase [Pantoea stewartii]|uniref:TraI/MobA(P) family conjugative relaxase n=1 Tax=Pantoea stewartii TaxID=66269 RepID=UPI00073657DE|nr:TraI/MobA(P) family conjugative relaxase [Pantoea stewartii]KTS26239.1 mobilization protein [Pantoea stewartii]